MSNDTGQPPRGPKGACNSTSVLCAAARHGTRAAYVAGCRCPEARKANRDYAKYRDRRTAAAAFGAAQPFTVPAGDVVAVLDQLRGVGWSLRRIEAETGIGRDHIARIYGHTSRPCRRVRSATYERLRQLLDRDATVAGGHLVDAYPTWQRVRGLIALGYPKTWISQQIGVGRALQLHEFRITHRNAEKVRELADRYGATLGPSAAARRYAAVRGWTPDLLWRADDDDTTPDCEDVDQIAVDRFIGGDWTVPLNPEERFEVYRHYITGGHQIGKELQARLGINGVRAKQFRERLATDDNTHQEASA